jgi:hypothetical protein
MRKVESIQGTGSLPIFISSHDWLPLPIDFNKEHGDTVILKDQNFSRYISAVSRWDFHLAIADGRDQVNELRDDHPDHEVVVRLLPIAVNRQRLPIAAAALYSVHQRFVKGMAETPTAVSGRIHLLPPPNRRPIDEALRIVLEDFCGVTTSTTEPSWAADVAMPDIADLETLIDQKRKAWEDLQLELTELLAERNRRGRFKAILYETGIEAPQEQVRAVFEEMALGIKPSLVSDEFLVEFEGRELLVEVKGNEKSAKLTDLRQLIDYQLEHEQKHGSPIKSVLIVNAWRHLEPDRRGRNDTVVFPDNVVKRAKDNNIGLIDTVPLYDALNRFWRGNMDGKTVFEAIWAASGVVTL